MLRVVVEDNGIGIDESSKAMLFQQFSQVQRTTVGGSGLGLYSLSKRSDAIGGSCGMDNRKGDHQGSAFWFEVPYSPDHSRPSIPDQGQAFQPIPDQVSHIEQPTLNDGKVLSKTFTQSLSSDIKDELLKPMRILIIDDSIAVVKMLSNKLKGSGHTTNTAKDGAEGLEKMKSLCDDLDLVIIDLQMPIMDGIEATRLFREWELECLRCPMLPIICSSANCSNEAKLRAITAGIDSVLPKPFTMVALTDAFNEAVESSHSSANRSPFGVRTIDTRRATDVDVIDDEDTRSPALTRKHASI
jgi:CheY-like chemotaxis protein